MIRFLAAALLLASTSMPAFACDWNKSASTADTQPPGTVASQPTPGTAPAVPTTTPQPNLYTPS